MFKPTCGVPYANSNRGGRAHIVCMLGGMLGRQFVYDPNDPAAEEAALRGFDQWALGLRAQIESNLNRRLTDKELRGGLNHTEDEDELTRAKIKQERDALWAPHLTPENWAERKLREHKMAKRRERDPEGVFLEEQVDKLAANEAAAREKAKRDADPRRAKCVEDAVLSKLSALFDLTLPASELRAADHRLRIAREGDPKLYAAEVNAFKQRQVQRLKERNAPLAQQVTNANEQLKQHSTPFVLPSVTIDYEPGEPVSMERPADPRAVEIAKEAMWAAARQQNEADKKAAEQLAIVTRRV